MDQQNHQANAAGIVQPSVVTSSPAKKRNFTKWIIIILFIIAAMGTGLFYWAFSIPNSQQFVVDSKPSRKPSPSSSEDPMARGTDELKLLQASQKYTNTEHGYSFTYTGAWPLTENPDNQDFILQYVSKTHPGIIEGKFVPADLYKKSYCEQNREDTNHCIILPVAVTREVFIDKSNYIDTGEMIAYIVHPTQGALQITITDANFETNTAFYLILSSIQFTDEQNIKLQRCPDSWSEDRKIAFIEGRAIDAKDIDEQYVSQSCPK